MQVSKTYNASLFSCAIDKEKRGGKEVDQTQEMGIDWMKERDERGSNFVLENK